MPVKTYIAVYAVRDYTYMTEKCFDELIKARNLKVARTVAEKILSEAGPDAELLGVRYRPAVKHRRKLSIPYMERLLRRQRVGLRMFHRKNRPYRRGCRNYPTWAPNFH